MEWSPLRKMQLNQNVDRILNAPGNVIKPGGNLEMAFVFDETSDSVYLKTASAEAVSGLRSHSEIFRNVRCNVVHWKAGSISTEVMPLAYVQLGKALHVPEDVSRETKQHGDSEVSLPGLDELTGHLKLYHARSKCILIFTEGNYITGDMRRLAENLNPFLKTRILVITPENMIPGGRILIEAVKGQTE